jgi:F420H(2)-dependent quinone reductase
MSSHDKGSIANPSPRAPRLPPRWFVRTAWVVHRAIHRLTAGRRGLWKAKPGKWGTMRLTTTGRRTGHKRSAILGYYEDGPNLVTLAMNGWAAPEPAWWLNLQADPDTLVELKDGKRAVRGRAAEGAERDRLWARWREFSDEYDQWAALRTGETAVVVLEPRQQSTTSPS